MGLAKTPTCDVCGTEKAQAPGLGLYCPNNRCGEEAPAVDDTPPSTGHYVQINEASVLTVLQENVRKQSALLANSTGTQLYGVLSDGTERRLTGVKMRVRQPKIERKGPVERTTSNGIKLRLATSEGVTL